MTLLVASETGLPGFLAGPLKRCGHRVVTCLPEELPQAAGWAVDAVLLDCGPDAEKGLLLLRAVKTRVPEIPVFFITGKSSEAIIANAFRAGARDFFKKPVNPHELKEAILCLPDKNKNRDSPQKIQPLPPNLLRAIVHMERNFSRDICLQALAREAGLSRHHFCRAFKRHTGLTPMRFLAQMRMEKAKALLKESPFSVSMVAAEVGFNDLGGFIKRFKVFTGFTPGEFRKEKGRESLRLF